MSLPIDIFSKSDSLLLAFLNNSPAIGWLKDDEGRHVFLSDPYLEEIGVPCKEWFGKTDFDLWPASVAERFREDDKRVLETARMISFEDSEDITLPGGKERVWWVVKFPFWDSDGRGFVGGMAVDISDRKQAERERQILEREISEIAEKEQRRIAQDLHDGIGQELTAYSLFAASLAEKIDAAAESGSIDQKTIDEIKPLADKLSAGISLTHKHLQSISRGMFPVHVDADRLMTMLNELTLITNQLPGICCSIHGEVPPEFINDEVATHLFRIVQEAINNSVKHGNGDHINIALHHKDNELFLAVADNGCGMELPGEAESIREGMGLRIMRYRASLINATLTLESSAHGGTIVRCRLKK